MHPGLKVCKFCRITDPCIHTTYVWQHLWIYWILRKCGLAKDVVNNILKKEFKIFYCIVIERDTPVYQPCWVFSNDERYSYTHKYAKLGSS
jgi:hypothetical protein